MRGLNSARSKSRDAARIATIRELQKSLELYYDENKEYYGWNANEYYYARTGSETSNSCGYTNGTTLNPGIWCKFETGLSKFINPVPRNLDLNNYKFYYKYNKNQFPKGYGLMVKLENSNALSHKMTGDTFQIIMK